MKNLEITLIKQQMENIDKKIDSFMLDNKEEHSSIKDLIYKIDEKKADREVVDEIRSDIRKVVWIIISAVVLALMAVIFKQ